MILSYSIPNGFGDYLYLTIEAATREEADQLAAQQIHVAHSPSWNHYANPSFDLSNACVTVRRGPILEATLDSHELGVQAWTRVYQEEV